MKFTTYTGNRFKSNFSIATRPELRFRLALHQLTASHAACPKCGGSPKECKVALVMAEGMRWRTGC